MKLFWMAVCLSIAAAAPVEAQDVYETAIADHGQRQLNDVLAKRRLQQAHARHGYRRGYRNGYRRGPTTAAATRQNSHAICRDRRRLSLRLTPARARQLYALCGQLGYR